MWPETSLASSSTVSIDNLELINLIVRQSSMFVVTPLIQQALEPKQPYKSSDTAHEHVPFAPLWVDGELADSGY